VQTFFTSASVCVSDLVGVDSVFSVNRGDR